MPANVENSAEAIGWEKARFHSSPNEGQCQECSNYLINTITLFSHASKVMFKILQVMLQQYLNFQMYISWILKNQRNQRSNCQHSLDHGESKRVSGKKSSTGSKLGDEYIKAVYCHPAYLTYIQNTSCEMPGWIKHTLESRLPGAISITSNMQVTPPLWQKVKRN